jgi:hypothetical protein
MATTAEVLRGKLGSAFQRVVRDALVKGTIFTDAAGERALRHLLKQERAAKVQPESQPDRAALRAEILKRLR